MNHRSYFDSDQAIFKEGHAKIILVRFFEEYLYLPFARSIRSISSYLFTLQNREEIDSYILYSFIAIMILIILAGVMIT